MPGYRRLPDRLDEFVGGVPNKDITPEHFDQLEPDAQKSLTDHVANNPHPLFEQDDSVTEPEPVVLSDVAPVLVEQPEPATNEPQ